MFHQNKTRYYFIVPDSHGKQWQLKTMYNASRAAGVVVRLNNACQANSIESDQGMFFSHFSPKHYIPINTSPLRAFLAFQLLKIHFLCLKFK